MTPPNHFRDDRFGKPEKSERRHPPTQFKLFERRGAQRPVSDLSAKIIEHHINRPDLSLGLINKCFNGIINNGIEQPPRCRAAVGRCPVGRRSGCRCSARC